MEGQIVKIISNLYYVQTLNGVIACHSRGLFRNKNITPLVGDYVKINLKDKYILDIYKRKNSLKRPLVANVDQGLIVTSLNIPDFSSNLLDKLLLIMELNNIKPIICVTKMDLIEKMEQERYKEIFKYYEKIGYSVYYNNEIEEIKKIFKNKVTVFTGQSGSGKSTLLNRLDETLDLETGDVSKALGRGRHTTRITSLIDLFDGKVVDTPGFSNIDLSIFSKEDIKNGFIEFKKYPCKYKDCMHYNEDISSCLVKQKVKDFEILKSRYDNYIKFLSDEKK